MAGLVQRLVAAILLVTTTGSYFDLACDASPHHESHWHHSPYNSDDYCDSDYCPTSKANIGCGCNFSVPIGPGCIDKAATLHILTQHHQDKLVDAHNHLRNMLACGGLNRFPPAARMMQLRWDNELQALAECNVKNCKYAHDLCRNTERFRYAGQNIAKRTVCGRLLALDEVFDRALNAWFDEFHDTTLDMLNKFPKNPPRKPIGHFTVMASDNVYYVGCALMSYAVRINVYFDETGEDCRAYYFACNYSFNNVWGKPTYRGVRKPASGCKRGKSKSYACLCSINEHYETAIDWEDEVL
ncbi:antigen 5 like allergen Cul n 1-like [Anopheles aquasalis]|uniref:antigen 5 like allergen Cul n 1-like n=1 Tax=Anopheles aquasalis TaxID=42839 RepID=UPI00215A5F22|nr:antigen 5 like allergen Cul n 1-like [Anopheles aquasalis]XP_050096750.1 antigen 5 like allergen Cul n 1-like [Anopheles aquasalis]